MLTNNSVMEIKLVVDMVTSEVSTEKVVIVNTLETIKKVNLLMTITRTSRLNQRRLLTSHNDCDCLLINQVSLN